MENIIQNDFNQKIAIPYTLRTIRLITVFLISIFIWAAVFPNGADAETGSINLSSTYQSLGYAVPQTGADSNDYETFYFLTSTYNSVDDFWIITSSNTLFNNNSNSSYFTCVAPNSCEGYVYYSKLGNIIYWDYFNAYITQNPIVLSYETYIFDSTNINSAGAQQSANNVNATMPMCMRNVGAGGQCSGGKTGVIFSYYSQVMATAGISYNVSYPYPGFYVYNITKQGTVLSTVVFENSTAIQGGDVTPNYTSSSGGLPYTTGLWVNGSITGDYEKILINSTNAIGYVEPETPPETNEYGIGLKFDEDSYYKSETANISYIRNSDIPFGAVDTIYLINPDGTETFLTNQIDTSGHIKQKLSQTGTYKVVYNRWELLNWEQILDTDTAIVNPMPASYIIVNSTIQANVPTNITYFNGNENNVLNEGVISYFDLALNTYIDESSMIVFATETNLSFSCNRITKWKVFIPPSTNAYFDCVVGSSAPYSITTSNLSVYPTTVSFGDWITIDYEIASKNWTNNKTFLIVTDSSGFELFNLTLSKQKLYGDRWKVADKSDLTAYMHFKTGTNTIWLNSSYGNYVLGSKTMTVSFLDADGFGLTAEPTYCKNSEKTLKYYAPDNSTLVFYQNGIQLKYVPVTIAVNGKDLNFNLQSGEYEIHLVSGNQTRRTANTKVTSCETASTEQEGSGNFGMDGFVILLFGSLTEGTKFVFALLLMVLGFIMGSRSKNPMGSVVGCGAMFLLSGFVGYIPVWVMIIVVLILLVLTKVFR